MSEFKYDVLALGNAIVDVLVQTNEGFLEKVGLHKGSMRLIDEQEAQDLYAKMGPAIEISGGSAANTIAGVASLGGRAAYIGKVNQDQLGDVFSHDIRAAGVHFETPSLTNGPATGRSLILVTEDGERTMNTYLGAANKLTVADIDQKLIEASRVIYLEGYLFDPPEAKDAFFAAAKIARAAGCKVALTLSDLFCVERHRADFIDLIDTHVDILFANEEEAKSLYQVKDFDGAVLAAKEQANLVVFTCGSKGSIIFENGDHCLVMAEDPGEVVDTTGAGDLYAAGYLYGYTQGFNAARCGRIASLAAAEVISHMGARPQMKLADLVRDKAA